MIITNSLVDKNCIKSSFVKKVVSLLCVYYFVFYRFVFIFFCSRFLKSERQSESFVIKDRIYLLFITSGHENNVTNEWVMDKYSFQVNCCSWQIWKITHETSKGKWQIKSKLRWRRQSSVSKDRQPLTSDYSHQWELKSITNSNYRLIT